MDAFRKEWEEHPRQQAGYLGLIFYTWTLKIFRQDRKKQLNTDNIWGPFSEHRSNKLGDRLEKVWLEQLEKQKKLSKEPSLGWALFLTFFKEIIFIVILHLALCMGEVFLRPKLLGNLISSFSRNDDAQDIVIVALELIGSSFICSALACHYIYLTSVLGLSMRAAIVSTVFRKSLKLSKTALNDVSPGQIVNLVSNDVSRFEVMVLCSCYLWSSPIQTAIAAYFLYQVVGFFGFTGVAIIAFITLIQTYTAQLTSKFRRKIARETDQRIRLTDEVLAGILVIKLYAWEKPFTKFLGDARSKELRYVVRSNLIRALYMACNLSTTKLALFLTLSTYILSGFTLTTAQVFVIASYYGILNHTMAGVFIRGIQEGAECLVSLRRLQAFLLREEVTLNPLMKITSNNPKHGNDVKEKEPNDSTPLKEHDDAELIEENDDIEMKNVLALNGDAVPETNGRVSCGLNDLSVVVQDAKACWMPDRVVPTLSNMTFSIHRGQLVALIGSVGSGKSSLLHLLLGELKNDCGKLFVNGTVSYASQEPWIFGGSIRDNILLGLPYNRSRYRKVVVAACLTRDMELFPEGDQTTVGERGASLSGGQKARINLARAIYRDADIYLLDDPLSAVDAHVAKTMFRICFRGFLRHKTVILATHQLQFLDQVDKILFLQMGQIKDVGRFEDLMKRGHDFTKIVEGTQAITEQAPDPVFASSTSMRSLRLSESEPGSLMGSALSLSLRDNEGDDEEKEPLQDSNAPYQGNIFIDYLRSGRAVGTFCFFLTMLLLAQAFNSFCDYWMSIWAKTFDMKILHHNSSIAASSLFAKQLASTSTISPLDNVTSLTTTAVANVTQLVDVLQNVSSLLGTNGTSNDLNSNLYLENEWSDQFYVLVFGVAVTCLLVVAIFRGVIFVISSYKCSSLLHSSMTKSALYSGIDFFNNNSSGSILNKFSKDLGAMDEMLPKAIMDTCQTMGVVLGAVITTLFVNYFALIPVVFFIMASLLIRRYYMRTSTNLKRIENISRGPVYNQLNTCLQGLSTIRAQNAQNYLKMAFDLHQDLNTSCLFSYISCQQGYSFALEIFSIIYIAVVIFSCIFGKEGISGADLGLALTQSMVMTGMLQWGTRQSAEVVNMMTSVERLVTFTQLPPEDPNDAEKKKPSENWPTKGAIKLENLSMRYKKDGPPALNDVSLSIRPGEKIGIVGRTGAGKSTLTSVLFRLAQVEGKCTIDNLDTATLNLQSLRSSLAIIPQNPVLFSGDLRRNLDPFLKKSDHELWSVLEDIDISEIVKDGQGLNSRISDCGNNLSVGQRQLICLARAVLKNRNVIVLDEATASVDPETDAQIQKTIRKRFARCTVLTIAHRLNTIMDSDRILVMDAGRAVELDTPYNLLQNKKGHFYSLVQETGPQMASKLTAQAEENHRRSTEEGKENTTSTN